MINVGIIGLSPNNGHPYSFSAIINGYNKSEFIKSGWDVILKYLEKRNTDDFGITDVKVTHAWTQNFNITKTLCMSCKIKNPCENIDQMKGEIDALIIARDDWECHLEISKSFLETGIPVFIDKPLTLSEKELNLFTPYLENNKLMSCSGFRYAKELDEIRKNQNFINELKLINGTVINDIYKYGIHMIEAISGLNLSFEKCKIEKVKSLNNIYLITLNNNLPIFINCLGEVGKTFHLNLFSKKSNFHFDLYDNFTAFKKTLEEFFNMVKNNKNPINPMVTRDLIKILIRCKDLDEN